MLRTRIRMLLRDPPRPKTCRTLRSSNRKHVPPWAICAASGHWQGLFKHARTATVAAGKGEFRSSLNARYGRLCLPLLLEPVASARGRLKNTAAVCPGTGPNWTKGVPIIAINLAKQSKKKSDPASALPFFFLGLRRAPSPCFRLWTVSHRVVKRPLHHYRRRGSHRGDCRWLCAVSCCAVPILPEAQGHKRPRRRPRRGLKLLAGLRPALVPLQGNKRPGPTT